MLSRRCLLGAALTPFGAKAAALADVLERPAAAVRLTSRPSMLCIARAGDRLVAAGERGLVLCSDDNGHAWQQASVPVSVTLTGVQFIDDRLGWAIGHAGVVLHTVDGGRTWAVQLDGRGINAAMQMRADDLNGRLKGSPEALRAARLATQAQRDGPDKPLLALHFSDASHGWVVGAFGLALSTADGGRSWQSRADVLPNPKGLHFYTATRMGPQRVLAGEQGLLLSVPAAGDAPAAWTSPYRGSFFAAAALPADGLLLGGLRGTLLLRNGAGEFKLLESGTDRAIVSIAPLANDRIALVDQAGRLLMGSVPVGRFVATPADATRRWVAVAEARDGALVGAGNFGVARLPRVDPGLK